MSILRLILAGLVALAAVFATLFAALLVVFTGLVGLVAQFFRRPSSTATAASPRSSPRSPAGRTDVIDVVATPVSSEPPKL
ncbi:MAG TPA: hypothetical protein PKY38_14060 [Opitutaceae bacterium]|nr:hypothetical protein [Opitutaceae bacterium]